MLVYELSEIENDASCQACVVMTILVHGARILLGLLKKERARCHGIVCLDFVDMRFHTDDPDGDIYSVLQHHYMD